MIAMQTPATAANNSRPVFRVLCAWCDQPIEQARRDATLSGTSHGICVPCARRHFGLDLESLADQTVSAA
jgi:hypothetical protein